MRKRPARGMSLVEVLVAAAILTVGLLAAISALAVGFRGVDAAHRSSVALFLAEERLEEVRAFALGLPPAQGLLRLTADRFPAEGYGTIPGRPGYRRVTEVEVEPEGLRDTRRVSVTVFYRAPGVAEPGPETFERLGALLALP